MKKFTRIINDETKQVDVLLGDINDQELKNYARQIGFEIKEVEEDINGNFYLHGFAPRPGYADLRKREYPPIEEQLDLLYWDKVEKTNNWQDKISEIKRKYPKNETDSNIDNTIPAV